MQQKTQKEINEVKVVSSQQSTPVIKEKQSKASMKVTEEQTPKKQAEKA